MRKLIAVAAALSVLAWYLASAIAAPINPSTFVGDANPTGDVGPNGG